MENVKIVLEISNFPFEISNSSDKIVREAFFQPISAAGLRHGSVNGSDSGSRRDRRSK
jgi:hypothetical protein